MVVLAIAITTPKYVLMFFWVGFDGFLWGGIFKDYVIVV